MKHETEMEALRTRIKQGDRIPILRIFTADAHVASVALRDYTGIDDYKRALLEAGAFIPFARGELVSFGFQLEDDRYALLLLGLETTGGGILKDIDAEPEFGVESNVFDKDTIEILRNFVYVRRSLRYAREMVTTLSRLGHDITLYDNTICKPPLTVDKV